MGTTGLDVFDRTVQETNVWLKELGEELHWDDRKEVYHAFRTVLHLLRDRLPDTETADLLAQFPILVKGIAMDGWQAREPLKIRHREEFLEQVAEAMQEVKPVVDPERVTRAVFTLLAERVSEGEMEDVRRAFPEELRGLWPEPAATTDS